MAEVLRRRLGGRSVEDTARVSESTLALVQFTVHTDRATPSASATTSTSPSCRTSSPRWSAPGTTGCSPSPDDRRAGRPAGRRARRPTRRPSTRSTPSRTCGGSPRSTARATSTCGSTRPTDAADERRLTLYLAGAPATLTAVLPVLQQLGVDVLDEHPAEFTRPDGAALLALRLRPAPGRGRPRPRWPGDAQAEREQAFGSAFRAGLARRRRDRPVRRAGAARRAALARGRGAARLRPLRPPARQLVRPDLRGRHPAGQPGHRARPDGAVPGPVRPRRSPTGTPPVARGAGRGAAAGSTQVTSLDADRILRSYLAMITATLRTNFYRDRPFFSFKIDPAAVPDMPAPRPRFEIFVYSPRIEGVHLRFGPVARGGLRWSDRQQDYRTEILGLVKAQAVKNAVIVPVGAKGGFVVRARRRRPGRGRVLLPDVHLRPARRHRQPGRRRDGPASRPAAGRGAPRRRRLLPGGRRGQGHRQVLRHRQRGGRLLRLLARRRVRLRWLGRLRPQGHGHHRQGRLGERQAALPRARAWTPRREEFTVVGIGDMSGDVFGNGMLLSPHIRLLAAFDHRHVFVDPDPDAARSLRRAAADVRAAPLLVGRLRPER